METGNKEKTLEGLLEIESREDSYALSPSLIWKPLVLSVHVAASGELVSYETRPMEDFPRSRTSENPSAVLNWIIVLAFVSDRKQKKKTMLRKSSEEKFSQLGKRGILFLA